MQLIKDGSVMLSVIYAVSCILSHKETHGAECHISGKSANRTRHKQSMYSQLSMDTISCSAIACFPVLFCQQNVKTN
jgi:hypothetical protein